MTYLEKKNFRGICPNSAQNLIEFIFILPLLLIITLVVFEAAYFWQEVNAIYNLNAEINANASLANVSGMPLGSTCTAAKNAKKILEARDSMISLTDSSFGMTVLDGKEPFALYKIASSTSVNVGGASNSQATLWVDCRNPFEEGITTQLEFYHKTMIVKATIPRFDKPEGIVVIPENIFIASPKLSTLRHY